MTEQLANGARSSLASTVNASQTTWTVADGSSFPAVGNFRVVCETEYALCTARSGNVLTVTRGIEGSTAASHTSGTTVVHELTVGGLTQFISEKAVLSGSGMIWFSNTPPAGYAILDGSTLTNAATNYPTLYANVDAAWKSGNDIILPDIRGRIPVGKGTHTDVDTLNDNDGVAVGSRRPAHAHSSALTFTGTGGTTGTDSPDHAHAIYDPGHSHSTPSFDTGASGPSGGTVFITGTTQTGVSGTGIATYGANARHAHGFTPAGTIGGTIGAAGVTDSPAFIVVNWIIKL